jgi:hypothetical protein
MSDPTDLHIAVVELDEVITILTDSRMVPRWSVHPAPARVMDGDNPYAVVSFDAPVVSGGSMPVESWGRIDPTVRVACWGASIPQAEWLRRQLLERWPRGWSIVATPAATFDSTTAPGWWQATFIVNHHPT